MNDLGGNFPSESWPPAVPMGIDQPIVVGPAHGVELPDEQRWADAPDADRDSHTSLVGIAATRGAQEEPLPVLAADINPPDDAPEQPRPATGAITGAGELATQAAMGENPEPTGDVVPPELTSEGSEAPTLVDAPPKRLTPEEFAATVNQPGDRYRYIGPDRDIEGLAEYIPAYIRTSRETATFEGESRLTDGEVQGLQSTHEALAAIGSQLGIADIRGRLPKLPDEESERSDYHVFDRENDYVRAAKPHVNLPEEVSQSKGITIVSGLLWVRDPIDTHFNLAGMTHEATHDISIVGIEPSLTASQIDSDGNTHVSLDFMAANGYQHVCRELIGESTHVGRALDEVVSDMLTDSAMQLAGQGRGGASFPPLTHLAEAMVIKTAAQLDLDAFEVERALIKGKLDGSTTGLEQLHDCFGDERMERIMTMSPHFSLAEAKTIARELDLPYAVKRIERAEAGRLIQFFEWQRRWS